MFDQTVKAGGKPSQITYCGQPRDWHNQTLMPSPDTLYFMGFYDTKAPGPIVVEIRPAGNDGSLNGNFRHALARPRSMTQGCSASTSSQLTEMTL